jgi:hypothetical protein
VDKNTITLILSITTVLISFATFSVAYSQMKIASAKTKLDLYNKRFNIYISALDYYQATWHKSLDEIKEKSIEFTKSYRESQFLFDESDGVYGTLGKIQKNGSQIYIYEQHKYERENNLTRDRLDLDTMHEGCTQARFDFEANLKTLEKQIEKYIQFTAVRGWKFF